VILWRRCLPLAPLPPQAEAEEEEEEETSPASAALNAKKQHVKRVL